MNFKYGTESVGIDFFYTDTTPFLNRGVEGLIEDIDMSVDNSRYGFAFESCCADFDIIMGLEADEPKSDKPEEKKDEKTETTTSNSKADAWYKKVWNAIVGMFKTIGKWFSSAWKWIKKKFGFGGTNDVGKVAETEVKVSGNSTAKTLDKLKDADTMTAEELDTVVEEIVGEEIDKEKNVNLKPIQNQITENVKNQVANSVEASNKTSENKNSESKPAESNSKTNEPENKATNTAREKLSRRSTGRKTDTIAAKHGANTNLSVKRTVAPVTFKSYLFSKRVISEFKEFKKVYASYTSSKLELDNSKLNLEKAVLNGAKFMAGTLTYLGALSKMLFKNINFDSNAFTTFTQNASEDTMKSMIKATDDLERSLITAVNANQTLDLEEVVFQIRVKDNIKKELDKSTYLFEFTTPQSGLADSVEISKAISTIANNCLSDISKLDKFVTNLSNMKDSNTRGMSRDSTARIKALRTLMSNTKGIGSNVYKLLSRTNIIKVRTTVKTDDVLGGN